MQISNFGLSRAAKGALALSGPGAAAYVAPEVFTRASLQANAKRRATVASTHHRLTASADDKAVDMCARCCPLLPASAAHDDDDVG